MFGNMLDVSTVRNHIGAFWFYVMSVIVLLGSIQVLEMTGILGGIGSVFSGHDIHTLIGTAFALIISGLIVSGRNLSGDLYAVLLTLVAVYLSYTTDVMIGLIPVALLTTLHTKK